MISRVYLISAVTIMVLTVTLGCQSERETSSDTSENLVTVVDGLGREVTVPHAPQRVICSGPGCLRLLTYLQAQDKVIAVDDMEGRRPAFDARPYAMAHPEFKELPVFGEFRGHDNPELILTLNPPPQVIFKTYPDMGMDPLELESKTGIPVIVLNYGNLGTGTDELYRSLRTMGEVMNRSSRAEEVICFLDSTMADLESRTADIPREERVSCFVGGIAYRGPHGFQSTEPAYPPFELAGAANVARMDSESVQEHADIAREQIIAWDPEVIFLDASTLQSDPQASALYQLENDPAYEGLSALNGGNVYGLIPYNWYTKNFGSILADAYFIGKTLYPQRFSDIDPAARADEIYTFLVGDAVFDDLNASFQNMLFTEIDF